MGGRYKPAKVTVYLQAWYSDIVGWLELKKPTGSDSLRARNLDYALIIPDLFMKRVEKGEKWSMFCPTQA